MTRRVFWTGGFDSTFRVLDLLRRGERVEALYLLDDPHWNKRVQEVDARERIARAIPAELRRNLLVQRPEYDAAVWARHETLKLEREWAEYRTQMFSSQQNTLLVAGAEALGDGIEVSLVSDDAGSADLEAMSMTIRASGKFSYPLLNVSKRSMLRVATKYRFDHLLRMTWSCEEATSTTPCGKCECCLKRIIP